jgi:ABC-type multidrug transport system fused ATPase/permease subunit
MSAPLIFGKLVDFFSIGTRPVSTDLHARCFLTNHVRQEMLPEAITPTTAAAAILVTFTIGAIANAGRVILMRSAAARIIARLRKATYGSALRQDIEYLERSAGPGDVVSRLNADAYIVGEA